MSDPNPSTPPVPPTPPAQTAGDSPVAPPPPAYPAPQASGIASPPDLPTSASGAKSFFSSLLDFKFSTFVTRKVAGIFYMVALILVAIGAVVWFLAWLVTGFTLMQYQPGAGILLILGAIVVVPIVTFLEVLILRIWVELIISVIVIAENTRSLRK